jgi:hypothetical protein
MGCRSGLHGSPAPLPDLTAHWAEPNTGADSSNPGYIRMTMSWIRVLPFPPLFAPTATVFFQLRI